MLMAAALMVAVALPTAVAQGQEEDDGRVCIQSFPESLLCELGLSFDAFVVFGDDVVSIQPVGGVEEDVSIEAIGDDFDDLDDDGDDDVVEPE